jgi:carbonic anhydrase
VTDPAKRNSSNADFVEKINVLNVRHQIDTIVRQSDIVDDMLESKKIGIVGAVYDLATGRVNFLEDTFIG